MKKIFLGLVLVVAFSTISIEKKDLMSKEITLDQLVKLNVENLLDLILRIFYFNARNVFGMEFSRN